MKKPATLKINKKPAAVARNWKGHNVHSEPEGGDEGGNAGELIPARDVRFTGIMLDHKQFDLLLGEQAFNSFFNQNGTMHEPAFSSFSTIWLDDVYKDCTAKIVFGVSAIELELKGATIKNISVKPKVGGMAELSFTLVAAFPYDLATLQFERFFGKDVTISVAFGPVDHAAESQQQLALENKPDADDTDDEDEEIENQRQLGEAAAGLQKQRGRKSRTPAGAH